MLYAHSNAALHTRVKSPTEAGNSNVSTMCTRLTYANIWVPASIEEGHKLPDPRLHLTHEHECCLVAHTFNVLNISNASDRLHVADHAKCAHHHGALRLRLMTRRQSGARLCVNQASRKSPSNFVSIQNAVTGMLISLHQLFSSAQAERALYNEPPAVLEHH